MKIQFHGHTTVDIPGVDGVEPGDVVEVDDEVGASLLSAGTSFDDDGNVVGSPEDPMWTLAEAAAPRETAKQRRDREALEAAELEAVSAAENTEAN